jgi:ABC-2 type transport system ATP-binding protein
MIVDTEHVSKKYGRVEVIKDLCLQVPEGSAFALVGTNGAGKTTTLRVLVNLIRPDTGRATVLGVDTRDLSHRDLTQIGYVSENQQLPERLTIAQYFAYLRALYPNWDRGLENGLRKQLELPPDRTLSKLSHGMRMKTVLVAGLAFRPKLLILDEPLSGMDTLTRDEVVEGLLQQADETTILISSHELSEIENFTSHIAFMDKGRLYFQESIESLRSRFREVNGILSARRELPESYPSSWLAPRTSGHSLQLIESKYRDHESMYRDLTELFGAVQFETAPMTLREVSKALIREAREASVPDGVSEAA